MNKALIALLALITFTGCMTVAITDEQRAQIDEMQAQGIRWSNEWKAGRYKPTVNMAAAVWWSIIPGAGQIFMAHHLAHSNNPALADVGIGKLRTKGILMLVTCWIGYVGEASEVFGLFTGTLVDVNRINNLDLATRRQQLKEQKQADVKAE